MMIFKILFLPLSGLLIQASPPPETVIIKQQQEICEKSRATDPNKDCSEGAIRKLIADRLAQHIKETTTQDQALKAHATEDREIYNETLLCNKTSGVICESPTGRRVQLATKCPQGWTTAKATVNKDCSPETIRKIVQEKAAMNANTRKKIDEAQAKEVAEMTKTLKEKSNSASITPPVVVAQSQAQKQSQPTTETPKHQEQKQDYDKIWNIVFAVLAMSLIFVLLHKWTLKLDSPLWSKITRYLFVFTTSLSCGIGAFWWDFILFFKIAGPSDGMANIFGFVPALIALFIVSGFVSAGLNLSLSPSGKFSFLQSPGRNFISFLGGSTFGLVAVYSYAQYILDPTRNSSKGYQYALLTTSLAPVIFLIVGIFVSLLVAKTLSQSSHNQK